MMRYFIIVVVALNVFLILTYCCGLCSCSTVVDQPEEDVPEEILKINERQPHEQRQLPTTKLNFENWQQLADVGGVVDKIYQPNNGIPINTNRPVLQDTEFQLGLQSLQSIVQDAIRDNKKIRTVGNKMSMSNIMYTKDYIIETKSLTYCKIGVTNATFISANYTKPAEQLVFVQAGVRLEELQLQLQSVNLALPTTCYPNGMHFVGAVLTGSHGSKVQLGAMDDYVKAVHIVTDTGTYLIQRRSDPVITNEYAQYMGNATLVTNDSLFNAAIVSFGTFGIVHGMLIAVEPMYRMKMEIKKFRYNDIKPVLSSLDMKQLKLKSIDNDNDLPYHLMFVINPYMSNTRTGVSVQAFRKINSTTTSTAATVAQAETAVVATTTTTTDTTAYDDVKGLYSTMSLLRRFSRLPTRVLYGFVVRTIMNRSFRTSDTGAIRRPYNAHAFGGSNTTTSAPSSLSGYTEVEVMVSSNDATRMVELYRTVLNQYPVLTFIVVRYFTPTNTTLGMGQYTPYTACVSAVSFEQYRSTYIGYEQLFAALRNSNIPHVFHWGKRYPINKSWITKQHNTRKVQWLNERDTFLSSIGKEMFSNKQLIDLGLHVVTV